MSASTPQERLRIAFGLAEAGEQMMRARLRREQPDATGEEIEAAMRRWFRDRPGAPYGDHPGPPSTRTLDVGTA